MESIVIDWKGPYRVENLNKYEVAYEYGLYTISRVWNNHESLIYIGKTERDFATRIKEHCKGWLGDVRGQIRVRIGILNFESNKHFSSYKLSDVESLLIVTHIPKNNYINTVNYYGRNDLIVINKGRRGSLKSRVNTEKDLKW